jgi:hypothetical protein
MVDFNFLHPVQEAPMSGEVFREIINNPEIMVGFELEFLSSSLDEDIPMQNINSLKMSMNDFWRMFKLNTENIEEINDYKTNQFREMLSTQHSLEKLADEFVKQYLNKNKDNFMVDTSDVESLKKRFMSIAQNNPDKVIEKIAKFAKDISINKYTEFFFTETKNNPQERIRRFKACPSLKPKQGWANTDDFSFYNPFVNKYPKFIDLANLLNKKFGMKFRNYDRITLPSNVLGGDWEIHDDGSLSGHGNGFELVSPPLPLAEAIDWMEKLFNWINNSHGFCYTNDTCGFHIGVSHKDENTMMQIDPLKFLLFIGDQHVLKEFERLNASTPSYGEEQGRFVNSDLMFPDEYKDWKGENENFATSTSQMLIQDLRKGNISKILKQKSISELREYAKKRLIKYKYQSIHVKKKYIEVRSAGGANYTHNIDKMKAIMLRYAHALLISCDPELYKQEYSKKIIQLFLNVEGYDIEQPIEPFEIKSRQVFGKLYNFIKSDIKNLKPESGIIPIENIINKLYDTIDTANTYNTKIISSLGLDITDKKIYEIISKWLSYAVLYNYISKEERIKYLIKIS